MFIKFASNIVKKGIALTVLSLANIKVLLGKTKSFANKIYENFV